MQNGAGAAGAHPSSSPPPSLDDAARALDAVDACLLGLLPSSAAAQGGGGAEWPTPEQAAQRAEALVDASATISRALRAFGRAGSTTTANATVDERRARSTLKRAIAGLEAEVRNADALLERSRASMARWRAGAEAAKGAIDQSLALPDEPGAGE